MELPQWLPDTSSCVNAGSVRKSRSVETACPVSRRHEVGLKCQLVEKGETMTSLTLRTTPIPDLFRLLEGGWPFVTLGDRHSVRIEEYLDDAERGGAGTQRARTRRQRRLAGT